MTYPGTPSVYYGDEIALRGTKRYAHPHRDVDARWPFPWHDASLWDEDMLRFFRQAIGLRHAHAVLRHGEFAQLYAESQQYAFARYDASQTLLVVLNAGNDSATVRMPAGHHFRHGDVLAPVFGTDRTSTVTHDGITLSVPARAGMVLVRQASEK